MIPPVAPGQTDEKQKMVSWKNTFSMRQVNLMNLAAGQLCLKNGSKSIIPHCCRTYSITSPSKSLELLRKNLQNAINRDIDNVIKKYLEKYFQPAINNIKNNLGRESVTEEHIKDACKQMLEDAKMMYKSTGDPECNTTETNPLLQMNTQHRKRKDLDLDTEITLKRFRTLSENTKCKPAIKCEGPKWDADRLSEDSLFIMGPRANKVLGYGQTRGRLYARHPDLVRYSGDQEDKEWLTSKNLMPASGGKAYVMILDDIKELTENDDYKNSPNLQLQELTGFTVPKFMLCKMQSFMQSCTRKCESGMDLNGLEMDRSSASETQIESSGLKSERFINISHISPNNSRENSNMLTSSLLMCNNEAQAITIFKGSAENDGCLILDNVKKENLDEY